MDQQVHPGGITRRSFIKRSVVAAVAAANLSILSGLVDAADGTYEDPDAPCRVLYTSVADSSTGEVTYLCWSPQEDVNCQHYCYDLDDQGKPVRKVWDCRVHKTSQNAMQCKLADLSLWT